ncbi:PaaI family thioesterase [Pseudomonas sp. Ant30-3]|uniref:PaaI family thioesterase n=1 Tax=Pseudomonas sp. Ant30-3 TaxID=1488328 RepID=UPI0004913555|nr:PaaI family thioesterase [Pseudomonas sp. Ant30-3]
MLDTLKQINSTSAFNRWAGFDVTQAERGEVELSLVFRPADMAQYAGFLHAGLIGALLDTACGFAAGTVAGNVLASHFSVNCLAPAVGEVFVARGHVVKAGKKQVFARAELFAQTGDQLKLVATGDAILVPVDAG